MHEIDVEKINLEQINTNVQLSVKANFLAFVSIFFIKAYLELWTNIQINI